MSGETNSALDIDFIAETMLNQMLLNMQPAQIHTLLGEVDGARFDHARKPAICERLAPLGGLTYSKRYETLIIEAFEIAYRKYAGQA